MYELIIIGGGPAGVAAGIYAARKKIKTALITDVFGGQSLVSADIQNWIGTKSISGFEFGRTLESHLRAQEGIDIIEGDRVLKVEDKLSHFTIETEHGKNFESKMLFIASGSKRRKLGVPGENKFNGKGVVYCSICDAPLFKGKNVAVVGGGNSGLEAVRDLIPYASKIYLLESTGKLRGDKTMQEKISSDPKIEVILGADILEILGETIVNGIRYKELTSGAEKNLQVGGVFVEIGLVPNSDIVNGLVMLNNLGSIEIDHKTQRTSHERIWAAGDVTDVLYKQNNISVGDAVKAILNIYDSIGAQGK
ncbi:MAG: FAD-dependent oxidoreductase [Patescibacteria group bacterium]